MKLWVVSNEASETVLGVFSTEEVAIRCCEELGQIAVADGFLDAAGWYVWEEFELDELTKVEE